MCLDFDKVFDRFVLNQLHPIFLCHQRISSNENITVMYQNLLLALTQASNSVLLNF